MENKFDKFKNTIWCAPKNYEIVNKHKELFTAFFKKDLIDPVVKSDSYAPEESIIVVLDNLQLKVVKIT
jgi:hypothetical protein